MYKRIIGILVVAAGCGQGTTPFLKSVQVVAAEGATIQVLPEDDAALAGAAIDIPPGALSQDTTITISATGSSAGVTGPSVAFGPAATVLAKAVTVTLPCTLPSGETSNSLNVTGVSASGPTVYVGKQLALTGNTVVFATTQLGTFVTDISVTPACPDVAAGTPWTECTTDGACVSPICACNGPAGTSGASPNSPIVVRNFTCDQVCCALGGVAPPATPVTPLGSTGTPCLYDYECASNSCVPPGPSGAGEVDQGFCT